MLLVQRCSSKEQNVQSLLAKIASFEKQEKITVQILSPDAIYSPLCVKAAFEMSGEKNGLLTAISLTSNFSSALKVAGAKDAQDFVLAAWGKKTNWAKIAAALGIKKLAWGKKNIAHFSKFYGISKEALALYSMEKLIIEKMALARL